MLTTTRSIRLGDTRMAITHFRMAGTHLGALVMETIGDTRLITTIIMEVIMVTTAIGTATLGTTALPITSKS